LFFFRPEKIFVIHLKKHVLNENFSWFGLREKVK
jgi:hypothetical protein